MTEQSRDLEPAGSAWTARALLRAVLSTSAWSVLTLGALVASGWYHLQTPLALRAAVHFVEGLLGEELAGRVLLGAVEFDGTDHLVVHDVRAFDPEGRRVLRADLVDAYLDLPALLQGEVHVRSARLVGGAVWLIPDEAGVPSIARTFQPRNPGPPGASGGGITVRLDGLQLSGVLVEGSVTGVRGLRARNVDAAGRVLVANGRVRIELDEGSFELPKPYGDGVHVHSVSGSIEASDPLDLALTIGARRGGDRVTAFVTVHRQGDAPVELDVRLQLEPLTPETLTGAGVPGMTAIRGPMQGTAHLFGSPPSFGFTADLRTDAGPLHGEGRIEPNVVHVDVTTPGFDLEQLLSADVPALHLAGTGHLDVDLDPSDGRASGYTARVEAFEVLGVAVPALEASGAIEEGRVRIDRVTAPHLDGELLVEGEAGFDGHLSVRVRASLRDVGADPNVRRLAPGVHAGLTCDLLVTRAARGTLGVLGKVALRGVRAGSVRAQNVRFSGRVRGDPERPDVHAYVEADGLVLGGQTVARARLDVQGGPRRYAVSGTATDGARSLELLADVEAQRGGVWDVRAPHIALTAGALEWRGAIEDLRVAPRDGVTFSGVVLASGTQRLDAHGEYRFHGPDEIEANVQDFDLSGLSALADRTLPDVSGRVDANLQLGGDLESAPRVVLQGLWREGRLRGAGPLEAVYAVTFEDRSIQVDVQVESPGHGVVALNGGGSLGPERDTLAAFRSGIYRFSASTDALDLDVIDVLAGRDAVPIGGLASAEITLSGSVDNPAIDVHTVRIEGLSFADTPPLELLGELHYTGGVVIGDLRLADDQGELATATLQLSVDNPAALFEHPETAVETISDGQWSIRGQTAQRRLDSLPWPASLRGSAGARLPIRASARLLLEHVHPGLSGDLDVNARWDAPLGDGECASGARPELAAVVHLRGDAVTASARLGLDATTPMVELTASTQATVEQWIHTLSAPTAVPAITLTARAHAASLADLPIACSSVFGTVDAELVVANWLSATQEAQLSVHAPVIGLIGHEPLELTGSATASGAHQGGVAKANLREGRGGTGSIVARTALLWPPGAPVPTLPEDARFSLHAVLDAVHLAPALALVPGTDNGDAIATGEVSAEGTARDLSWTGQIDLREGAIDLVAPGQRLDSIAGRIVLNDHIAELIGFEAHDLNGVARVVGSVEFAGLVPQTADLSVDVSDFPVRREGVALATLGGHIDFSSTLRGTRAVRSDCPPTIPDPCHPPPGIFEIDDEGCHCRPGGMDSDVRLAQVIVQIPRDSLGALQSLDEHPDVFLVDEERHGDDAAIPNYQHFPLRFHVVSADPMWLRRNDLAAQMTADLHVLYDDPRVELEGYVNLRRGYFEIYGKRFDLTRGSLSFDPQNGFDPAVDLVASYSLGGGDTKITVSATGRLSALSVDFSSTDPALSDRSAIISALVTGSRTRIGSDPTGSGTAPEAQAASFLASVTAGLLTGLAREELGGIVPVIVIESGDQAFTSARVRAGFRADQFIRDNLPFLNDVIRGAYIEGFVSAGGGTGTAATTGQAGTTRAGFVIELQFPENIVGNVTFAQPNNIGFDVFWEP